MLDHLYQFGVCGKLAKNLRHLPRLLDFSQYGQVALNRVFRIRLPLELANRRVSPGLQLRGQPVQQLNFRLTRRHFADRQHIFHNEISLCLIKGLLFLWRHLITSFNNLLQIPSSAFYPAKFSILQRRCQSLRQRLRIQNHLSPHAVNIGRISWSIDYLPIVYAFTINHIASCINTPLKCIHQFINCMAEITKKLKRKENQH